MLSEIIKAFKETNETLDFGELSRRLGTERSALEGMLETLVRQGKLKEVEPGSAECDHCGNRAGCGRLKEGTSLGKVYELARDKGRGG